MRNAVIDTGALFRLKTDEEIFKAIKNAGFTNVDYSLFWIGVGEHIGIGNDYKENAIKVRKLADSYGLKIVQSHAIFFNGIDEESMAKRIDIISKDIEIASILGAKAIVIHPVLEYSIEQNVEFFKKYFIPLAHKFDIKIAIENTWGVNEENKICRICTSYPKGLIKLIDDINDEYVVACLDIGHAEMNQLQTSAVEMINALGPRLYCMHLHDNDKWWDAHQMLYTGKINYDNILQALKKNNYQGNITFEIETCYNRGEDPTAGLPIELFPAYIKLEYEIGKYWIKYLEK